MADQIQHDPAPVGRKPDSLSSAESAGRNDCANYVTTSGYSGKPENEMAVKDSLSGERKTEIFAEAGLKINPDNLVSVDSKRPDICPAQQNP